MKKLMKMIIIIITMNKSQELTIFHGRSRVSKKVNRKFVLVGDTARANPT